MIVSCYNIQNKSTQNLASNLLKTIQKGKYWSNQNRK